MSTPNDPWGRVDADGTVFVRTADGERVIGSWQAGDAAEALAFFKRKFDALVTEVELLEQRIKTTDLSPAHAQAGIERLIEAVTDAHAIGDLDGLLRAGSRHCAAWSITAVRSSRRRVRAHARKPGRSRNGSSPRPSALPRRQRTGRSAASGCASCWRSGRRHRTRSAPSRPRCGSGCPRRAMPSPSAARPTSRPWKRAAGGTSGSARRSWSPRPRPSRHRPTGRLPRTRSAS